MTSPSVPLLSLLAACAADKPEPDPEPERGQEAPGLYDALEGTWSGEAFQENHGTYYMEATFFGGDPEEEEPVVEVYIAKWSGEPNCLFDHFHVQMDDESWGTDREVTQDLYSACGTPAPNDTVDSWWWLVEDGSLAYEAVDIRAVATLYRSGR